MPISSVLFLLFSAHLFFPQRQPDGYADEGRHHCQGESHGNLVYIYQHHLHAYEHEHGGQPVFEQRETVGHIRQQEVHGAQTEDRKDVGGQNDEGIGGDCKDGGDGVDCKDKVCNLNQDEREKERRGVSYAVQPDKKILTMKLRGYLHVPSQPFQGRILLQVRSLLGEPPHLDPGNEEEYPENIKNPMELGDEPGAGEDHDGPHNDRPQHAENQHALLQLQRNAEEREKHQPDEDVVDGKGLFDQIAGGKLEGLLIGHHATRGTVQIPPEAGGKKAGDNHPHGRPRCRLAKGDAMLPPAASHEKINGQHDHNDRKENSPQPGIADTFHFVTQFTRICGEVI